MATSLSTKASLSSPALTGTPTAPTAAADTSTTQVATTAFVLGQASTTVPVMDGSAAVGSSFAFARADHVHGSDTSKASLSGATFTGNVSVVSPTSAGSNGVRQITMSTSAPSGGSDGDMWLVYV